MTRSQPTVFSHGMTRVVTEGAAQKGVVVRNAADSTQIRPHPSGHG